MNYPRQWHESDGGDPKDLAAVCTRGGHRGGGNLPARHRGRANKNRASCDAQHPAPLAVLRVGFPVPAASPRTTMTRPKGNAHLRDCEGLTVSPRRIPPPQHRRLPARTPSASFSKPQNLSGISGFPCWRSEVPDVFHCRPHRLIQVGRGLSQNVASRLR